MQDATTAKDTSASNLAESLSLKETEFDFGKIPQGKPVTHDFEFKNTRLHRIFT